MALPSVYGDTAAAAYTEFIQNYGTHYVAEVYMGAKAIHQSEFTSSSYQSLKSSGINIQVFVIYQTVIFIQTSSFWVMRN